MQIFDEWSPLEEVIVGRPMGSHIKHFDLSFKMFFHDNLFSDLHGNDIYYGNRNHSTHIKQQYINEHEEDIEGFVDVLKGESINVLRPRNLVGLNTFETPYWKSITTPALNIRDQVFIYGNCIIETPTQVRCRYFENDLLKHIFLEKWKQGCRWISAPRAMLLDDSFDTSYVCKDETPDKQETPYDIGYEIIFDAAQCLKFGHTILMNISNFNHLMGARWLQENLYCDVKIVRICDNHIDSAMMPLKEGSLLVNPQKVKKVPDFLQNWDIIEAPEPKDETEYTDDDLLLASKYIDVNVLSLDGEKIIVNETSTSLIKLLESKGFIPIPVRLRHRRIFGGSFHCITLDTKRK